MAKLPWVNVRILFLGFPNQSPNCLLLSRPGNEYHEPEEGEDQGLWFRDGGQLHVVELNLRSRCVKFYTEWIVEVGRVRSGLEGVGPGHPLARCRVWIAIGVGCQQVQSSGRSGSQL